MCIYYTHIYAYMYTQMSQYINVKMSLLYLRKSKFLSFQESYKWVISLDYGASVNILLLKW